MPAGDQGDARPHPETLGELPDYWCYWHGTKGYSGVALHRAQGASTPTRPMFVHPAFDVETRIAVVRVAGTLVASIYVPNGGKDFAAKVRFLEAMAAYAAALRATGERVVLCGDLNVARTDQDVHPQASATTALSASDPTSARCSSASSTRGLRDVGRDAGSRQRRAVHLVGAVAEHAPAQHRLAARLRARERPLAARATSRCVSIREYGRTRITRRWSRPSMSSCRAPEPSPDDEPPPSEPKGQLSLL